MLFVKSYEARLFFGQAKLRVRGLRWNLDGIFPNLQREDPQVIQCLIEMLRAYIALGVCSHQGVEAGKVVYTCQKLAKARTLAEEISEWVLCGGLLLRRTERRSYMETSDVSHVRMAATDSFRTNPTGWH